MIATEGDIVARGNVGNFKGKKAAPFAKGGGRKKSSSKTAKGTKKRKSKGAY